MICMPHWRRAGVRKNVTKTITTREGGVHLGVCAAPVEAWRMIRINGKILWHESIDRRVAGASASGMMTDQSFTTASGAVTTAGERCYFDAPDLFAKGDGVDGFVEFYPGGASQIVSQNVRDLYTATGRQNAEFRAIGSLLFDGFKWGSGEAARARILDIAVQVTCLPPAPELDQAYALIPGANSPLYWEVDRDTGSSFDTVRDVISNPQPPGANPAHVLYALLTEEERYGAAVPKNMIDTASFDAAAQKLHAEGFKISFIIDTTRDVRDVIGDVIEAIQAVLWFDGEAQKWKLTLLRDDYDPDDTDIPTIDPSSARLLTFSKKTCGATISEVEVSYTDPVTEETTTITARDEATWTTGKQPIPAKRDYYMIRDHYLAWRCALRDLRQLTWPQKLVTVDVDHSHWKLKPGDVVRFTWPDLGVQNALMRVITADAGSPTAAGIRLSLAEDIYSLDQPTNTVVSPIPFSGVHTEPTPMDVSVPLTAPYVLHDTDEDPAGGGLAMLFAHDAAQDCSGFKLLRLVQTNAGQQWLSEGDFTLTDKGTLGISLTREAETKVALATLIPAWSGKAGIRLGDWLVLGNSEDGHEIMVATAYDSATDEITLLRGAYDTIPMEWPAGETIWMTNEYSLFLAKVLWPHGSHSLKLLTVTELGTLPEASAPTETLDISDRAQRPTRPAGMAIEGTAWPADANVSSSDSTIVVTWANRNRLTEEDALKWTDASATPESGQETIVEVLDTSDAVIASYTAAEGDTSYNVPAPAGQTEYFIRLTARRDGLDSLHRPKQKVVVT